MQRLLFLSSISGLFASGCSDDCGPGSAPKTGLLASSADVTLNYGNLTSSANNDCRDPTAPAGVISLTIDGTQTDAAQLITFCIPRPDQLMAMDQPLGTGLKIIDFNGEKDGCMYSLEPTRPVTGTVHVTGMCDNGTNSAGYALGIDGNISLRRVCTTTTDTIAVTLQGLVAVAQKK
ncbi:MAG TPA: hypothetical protein VIV40_17200 [Kofleriaceae bacterium]